MSRASTPYRPTFGLLNHARRGIMHLTSVQPFTIYRAHGQCLRKMGHELWQWHHHSQIGPFSGDCCVRTSVCTAMLDASQDQEAQAQVRSCSVEYATL
eukprot:scaffold122819_cov33-Tisochrysis_lutea.AAC.1